MNFLSFQLRPRPFLHGCFELQAKLDQLAQVPRCRRLQYSGFVLIGGIYSLILLSGSVNPNPTSRAGSQLCFKKFYYYRKRTTLGEMKKSS